MYCEKVNFEKKKKNMENQFSQQMAMHEVRTGKLLDGFLLLFSCRVKLPHEAIKSNLAS